MRYGFRLPAFGGWPRNVDDEGVAAVGVDLVRLPCSPRLEEMERFAQEVVPFV